MPLNPNPTAIEKVIHRSVSDINRVHYPYKLAVKDLSVAVSDTAVRISLVLEYVLKLNMSAELEICTRAADVNNKDIDVLRECVEDVVSELNAAYAFDGTAHVNVRRADYEYRAVAGQKRLGEDGTVGMVAEIEVTVHLTEDTTDERLHFTVYRVVEKTYYLLDSLMYL